MRSTLLLLMLMFQLQPNPLANDDGLDYARELGLVAQTELQATDNGYNFTITEIYADANRVTFTFEIDEPTSMGESIGFRPTLINGSDTEDDTAVVRRVERFEAPYTETATFRTPSALDGVAPYTLRVVAQQRTETLAEVTFSGEL